MKALDLLRVGGPAWVQDGGRVGVLHHGLPPGGGLVPEALAAANRAVGNPPFTAAIELFAGVAVAARGGDLFVSAGGPPRTLPADHVWDVPPPHPARVAYLAVRGGFDVPCVLGGQGLLAAAGLGGGPGRPLRGGDRLGVGGHDLPVATYGAEPGRGQPGRGHDLLVATYEPGGDRSPSSPIRVVRGPDPFAPAAWATLLAGPYRVSAASDRVGTRLAGPEIPREEADDAISAPMVAGAIQVPRGGLPIVLGPDHPTTGGYPVIAVVIRADQGALFARGPGAAVRFVAVGLDEARAATGAWRRRWAEPGR